VAPVLRFADVGYNAGEAQYTGLQGGRDGVPVVRARHTVTATIRLTPQNRLCAAASPAQCQEVLLATANHLVHLFLCIRVPCW
jgi:hypothetical protein